MTLTLTLTTIITSCLTLLICSIFINPLIQKIKQFNIKLSNLLTEITSMIKRLIHQKKFMN